MRPTDIFDQNDPFLEQFNGGELYGDSLQEITRSFDNEIREMGLDRLIEDLIHGGNPFRRGRHPINLIPGTGSKECLPVLVAVSKGTTGKYGFGNILKQVRTHLISCHPETKRVVFYCDSWIAKTFKDDFMRDFEIFKTKWEVEFLFLQVESGGISRVRVDI